MKPLVTARVTVLDLMYEIRVVLVPCRLGLDLVSRLGFLLANRQPMIKSATHTISKSAAKGGRGSRRFLIASMATPGTLQIR